VGCTPDYYNSCANGGGNVPNVAGAAYQYARTGDGICGVYVYSNFGLTREYIQGELYDSLIGGKKYCISFYVNLIDFARYSISNVGAYLSSSLINFPSCNNLPLIPQIENNPTIQLNDTMNWMRIEGEFIATGGEKYITIGNFRDDSITDTMMFNNTPIVTSPMSYYLIDDISVICCDCEDTSATNNNLFIPNAFSPNNDGHNDVLRVLGNASKIEFKVFDRWGEMVYSYTGGEMSVGTGWDGTYKGKALDNAVFVYFAKVTLPDGKEVEMKGNVSLIK